MQQIGQVSPQFIKTLILAMILCGAANTLVYKMQNKTVIYYKTDHIAVKFEHPFMQAVTMFIGEGLCILFFIFHTRKQDGYKDQVLEAENKGLKTQINYFYIAIPALADLITTTLQYIALNYISASIYQMLRGGVIVVTALFSKFFLKKTIKKFQLFGIFLVITGIIIVGITNFPPFSQKADDSQSTGKEKAIAMMLIVISLFTNGIHYISEEKLFQIYFLHPFQVVGFEGVWGLIFYIIIMPILTFTHCPSSLGSACVEHKDAFYFERPDNYFNELGNDGVLLFLCILGVFTIGIFNMAGVSVTKYVSSVARSVVDVTRTVIVWAVGLIVTFSSANEWENTVWYAILVELIGFIMLVLGNLVYNKIITLPFPGLYHNYNDVIDEQVSLQNQTQDE